MPVIVCPKCSVRLKVSGEQGEIISCQGCGQKLRTPRSPNAPPPSIKQATWALCRRLSTGAGFALLLALLFVSLLWYWLAALALITAVGFVALLAALIRARQFNVCEKCIEWQAMEQIGSQVTNVERCMGLVTRTVQRTTMGVVVTSSGQTARTVTQGQEVRQERVPVIRTTTMLKFRCRFCCHCEEAPRISQEEDFSRD